MVEVLTKLIYENISYYGGDGLAFDTKDVSEILSGLEEAGMKPPAIDKQFTDNHLNGAKFSYHKVVNEWEKENE